MSATDRLTEIEEWLEHFRESANPRTALERWLYLDTAATYAEELVARVRKLETLICRAAPFVNAVAVMADDKTPSLAWLADAAVLVADPAAEETLDG